MPTPNPLSGYKLVAGTKTVAQMTAAHNTYAIEEFPAQDDVRGGAVWRRPQSRGDIVQPAVIEAALDGSLADYGGEVVTWEFAWVSPKMIDYLYENIFSSTRSATVTIRTWDRVTADWRVFNCTAQWPMPDIVEGLRNIGGGFAEFPIRFIQCENAAAS